MGTLGAGAGAGALPTPPPPHAATVDANKMAITDFVLMCLSLCRRNLLIYDKLDHSTSGVDCQHFMLAVLPWATDVVMKESETRLREQLGAELRKARIALGLTQADVAEKVETDPETVSRFERGATLPSLTRLLDLADALDVSVSALLGAASPRATDELEELRASLAALPAKDRRLAAAIVKTIAAARGH